MYVRLEVFAFSGAHTVSELNDILDSQNDFNFGQFRLAYNYFVVVYTYTVDYFSGRGDELEALKSLGLLSLDPELLRYMAGLSGI